MVKLAALLAALPVTAFCVIAALYAAKLSVLVLLHWQAQIAVALFLYLIPMLVLVLRRKRQSGREPKEEPLTPEGRRPLREL